MESILKTKILFFIIFSLGLLLSYGQKPSNVRMRLGEKITYDFKYSFFKVAEAELLVDPEFFYPNGEEPYYLVTLKINSVGLLQFFYSNLHVCYESYISARESDPFYTEREIYHGDKIDIQHDYFRFEDSVFVENHNFRKNEIVTRSFPKLKGEVKDPLSSYTWFRSSDMENMENPKSVFLFVTNRLNQFAVDPTKEIVDYDGQKALKYDLVFPNMKGFRKGSESYVLISMDGKNIPIKFKLATKRGNFYMNLQKIKNFD